MSRKSGRRGYNSDTTTSSHRGGGGGGRERQEEDIVDLEEEEEEEEEEELIEDGEEDEITRCICGQDELTNDSINPELSTFLKKTYKIEIDQGLFIQCEKCSVWQHGYCVGLFESQDVPDEYWCESCKPEFHILVNNDGYSKRTLYKPVNDKRKKLEQMTFKNNETSHNSTRRRGVKNERNVPQQEIMSNTKDKRKERRHHHHHHNIDEDDDEYNEQLKRALRESARESGVKLSESESNEKGNGNSVKREDNKSDGNNSSGRESSRGNGSGSRKRETSRRDDDSNDSKRLKVERLDHPSGSELNENSEQELMSGSEESRSRRRGGATSKTARQKKKKSTPPRSSANNNNKKQDDSSNETNSLGPTKEELIQQPSKPRYVNDKSSIFELRKRTIAILEWLGRSQVELQEEKQQKLELFSFISDDDEKEGSTNSKENVNSNADTLALKETFDENLLLMEQLTERILAWQDTFGKYAV
ncbi:histone deacetylase complex subunit, putative [Candida dubliniensis CD36]|uniref:Histone deacetylase complex subunit, putative n=1 Tax=Candida dubliniensis (strain CD36 / ATCC MYA-646 / CBS 7987 / NCPF 3949 / NRRL Y-17841) TaxID=573826 RepID=B9WJ30_CANDC|nr:histone deacetylase complex subunit, putative [Candida dubliniensis CD36]CAX41250.1 histone deacetylase complex subunit, putative [Candida dubliniensis CD36]